MKKHLKKWAIRLSATGLSILALLLIIVLNPMLSYANKTVHGNFTIYHNRAIDPLLISALDQTSELIKTSELYNSALKLDICLNDDSNYPKWIKCIRGEAFAWGFYNKVVLQGEMNLQEKQVKLHAYAWNLPQLLAHEMTHCMQFDQFGIWKSNPLAQIPDWKWEGYAEYVGRQNMPQKGFSENITRLLSADSQKWGITLADNTIAPLVYYRHWLLVKYCLEIKHMSYCQLLENQATESETESEMMDWYHSTNAN